MLNIMILLRKLKLKGQQQKKQIGSFEQNDLLGSLSQLNVMNSMKLFGKKMAIANQSLYNKRKEKIERTK